MRSSGRRAGTISLLALAGFLAGCSGGKAGGACPPGPAPDLGPAAVPAEYREGEAKFNAHCAVCHGERGAGTDRGPRLIHQVYEPDHHPDAAFQLAAANGVRAHHCRFGNMPKIDGVSAQDVDQITRYIRWVQRQAGIR